MENYISVLKNTKLFSGAGENEISTMLSCLGAKLNRYKKGEYVFRAGEYVHNITVLVKGSLHIQKDDYWGNRTIINIITPGEMFGEAYVSPDSGALLNDVIAIEDSAVMFFDVQQILTMCPSACKFHTLALKNLFFAISEKNRRLVTKLGHISNRTTRKSSCHTYQMRPNATKAPPSPFPLTVSSWQIFYPLTAALCLTSSAKCVTKG